MKRLRVKVWQNRASIITIFALFLLVSGSAYFLIPDLAAAHKRFEGKSINSQRLAEVWQGAKQNSDLRLEDPVRLSLPRLKLEKEVKQGFYDTNSGKWTLDKKNAFWMNSAKTPLVYGHNIESVFKPLSGVAENEVLIIETGEGKTYLFKYVNDEIVEPSAYAATQRFLPNTFLVMTCSGKRYENRRILHFSFVRELEAHENHEKTG